MELKARFKVIMSSEADAFLDTLRQDIKDKIVYNVDKVANGYMDKDLFKKLDGTDIWEFRTLYKGIQYRLLAFGILMRKHWLLLRTDSSKRHKRPQVKRLTKRKLLENCISTQKIVIWKRLNFIPLMKLRISTLGKSGHHIGINMRLNCSRSLSVRLLRKPGNPKI